MQRLRYWRPLAAALLVCLAVPGCSTGHTTAKSVAQGGSATTSGASAPGKPTRTGSATAGGPAATGGASASKGSAGTGSGSASGGPAATGGGNVPAAPGSNGSAGAPGAPGGNGQNSSGGPTALGAPITIPDIVHMWSAFVAAAINSLEYGIPLPGETNRYTGIIAQCGGRLCLNVQVEMDPNNEFPSMTHCRATGITIPPLGTVVHRGATVWILTGTQPCPSYEPPWPPGSSGGTPSPTPSGGSSPSPSP